MKKNRRRKKLIDPALQLKLVSGFAITGAIAVIVQSLVLARSLTQLAELVPNDKVIVVDHLPGILFKGILISFLLLLPLSASIGILMSFRVAGPLYRFRVFLKQIIAGEKPEDCRLRKGDELMDFCELLNEATAPQRVRKEKPGEAAEAA